MDVIAKFKDTDIDKIGLPSKPNLFAFAFPFPVNHAQPYLLLCPYWKPNEPTSGRFRGELSRTGIQTGIKCVECSNLFLCFNHGWFFFSTAGSWMFITPSTPLPMEKLPFYSLSMEVASPLEIAFSLLHLAWVTPASAPISPSVDL
jgi:hypothetical protein